MKIGILGAGSVGTVLGAYLTKAGLTVDLIDVNIKHINKLNKNGANILGKVKFNQKVNAITPEQMKGIYDLIILLVKQTKSKIAIKQIQKNIGEDTTILTLQNGLPEYNLMKLIKPSKIIGGVVGWGSSYIEPGVVELTTDEGSLEFDIGEINGIETNRIIKYKEVLDHMCKTNVLDNLMGVRWNKIVANAAMSGMSAVLGCTFGDILNNKEALLRAKFIANECIQTCNASGVKMAVRHGYDHANLLHFKTIDEMQVKDWIFEKIWRPHENLKASMLQDLEKGNKTEVDYINGVVCSIGKQYRVSTPVNRQVVETIKRIERKEITSGFDNLKFIKVQEAFNNYINNNKSITNQR